MFNQSKLQNVSNSIFEESGKNQFQLIAQPVYKADCHFCFEGKLLLLALDIRGNVSPYHMIFVHLILYN